MSNVELVLLNYLAQNYRGYEYREKKHCMSLRDKCIGQLKYSQKIGEKDSSLRFCIQPIITNRFKYMHKVKCKNSPLFVSQG